MAQRFRAIKSVADECTVLRPGEGEVPEFETDVERRDYFVDEAGDPNLFDKKRRVRVGTNGCSKCFIIGCAEIADVAKLDSDLVGLRKELLADPALASKCSFEAERGKTAVLFHAAKDLPEVRRRVFSLLAGHQIRVAAVVRRKHTLAAAAAEEFALRRVRFKWEAEYDRMVARIFEARLHLAKHTHIVFAPRGVSTREAPLRNALEIAKQRFETQWGKVNPHRITMESTGPASSAGLQAVDYLLWALQRVYERGEWNYFSAHRHQYRLIVDVDDRRNSPAGAYYSDGKPLQPSSIMPFEG